MDDIRPVADIALPVVVPSRGDCAAVGFEPHRMKASCGDHKLGFEFSGDCVVAVHGDVGFTSVNISDGTNTASPADKAVTIGSHGHQIDHRSLVIGKGAMSRGIY